MNQTATTTPALACDAAVLDTSRAAIARLDSHLIGGEWVAGSGAPIPVLDPATAAPIGQIAAGGADEVDRAVRAARAAFDSPAWQNMPAAERERLLLRLADLVERHADELAAIETLDNGMPFPAARAMGVGSAISAIRYNAGWPRRLTGESVPVSVPGQWHGYTTHEALGVAALIVPWNAPLAITANKLSAALAAGCTVVLKPAELAPMTGLRLAELVLEAGFPAGTVNVVTGLGAAAGAALVAHPGVDKISFTGSTATGQSILRESAHDLKRVSLELGGKSATIVYPDADLARAVPGVAMGIFGNSGQVCAAGSRLFLHDSIHDEFLDRLAGFAAGLKVGPGTQAGVAMGPLISAGQRARVMGYIEAGLAEGATLLTGGDRVHRCPARHAHRPRGNFRTGPDRPAVWRRQRGSAGRARERQRLWPVGLCLDQQPWQRARTGAAAALGIGQGQRIGHGIRPAVRRLPPVRNWPRKWPDGRRGVHRSEVRHDQLVIQGRQSGAPQRTIS